MIKDSFDRIVLLADHGSVPLAQEVYKHLFKKKETLYGSLREFDPDDLYLNRFNNGECEVKVKTDVRGRDIFLIKSFSTIQKKFAYDSNANDKRGAWKERPSVSDCVADSDKGLMELFTINDALWRSAANKITDVLMFIPYLRQDKKDDSGVPITAKLVANLIEESGVNDVMTIHPHFDQFEGFFNKVKTSVLPSKILFAGWLSNNYNPKDLVILATDANSAKNSEKLAESLGVTHITAKKTRSIPGEVRETEILCDCSLEGKVVAIYDDLIDTGGSLINCVNYAKKKNAKEVLACITHPVLSGSAKENLKKNEVRLVTTDSIPIPNIENYSNITVLSLGYLISEAIACVGSGKSIHNSLHNFENFLRTKRTNEEK